MRILLVNFWKQLQLILVQFWVMQVFMYKSAIQTCFFSSVLTSASFCSRIWSLSNTSSSTALQDKRGSEYYCPLNETRGANVCLGKLNRIPPARSLQPLWTEVLIMQILSYLLEVLHMGPAIDETPIIPSNTRGQQNLAFNFCGCNKLKAKVLVWSKRLHCSNYYQGHSHKHSAQLQEVIVLGILHLHYTPGVQATTDLLPLHFNQLVGANDSKGNARLGKEVKHQWTNWLKLNQRKGHGKTCGKLKGIRRAVPVNGRQGEWEESGVSVNQQKEMTALLSKQLASAVCPSLTFRTLVCSLNSSSSSESASGSW